MPQVLDSVQHYALWLHRGGRAFHQHVIALLPHLNALTDLLGWSESALLAAGFHKNTSK